MFQAVARRNNRKSFVIGEITRTEAELASAEGDSVSDKGLYLISVDHENPSAAGVVLARFTSEDSAQQVAQHFRLHGLLEV